MNNTLMNRLGEIVGANGLVSEPSKVELETRTCIPFRQIPDCVVYPDSAEQVQRMVNALLCLRGAICADAADALASAICHAHRRSFQDLVVRSYGRVKSSSWRDYLETASER